MRKSSGRVFVGSLLALCALGQSVRGQVEVREEERDGKKLVIMESASMSTVLAPELARFPLSYVLRASGHEMFAQPTPLSSPNDGYRPYGGIVDCLPWVGGKPNKGLLYGSPWQWTTGKEGPRVWFEGATRVTYADPVDGSESALAFEKRVTAFDGSSAIRMEHVIRNVGTNEAGFLFVNHARTAIAGYGEGDYCYAPGDQCFVYYMRDNPELEARGVQPPCWTNWPLDEVIFLRPRDALRTAFAFIPASWSVAGDDTTREALFFIGSPVRRAGKTDTLKMGIFMTNAAYVMEPSLTLSLGSKADEWSSTALRLKPGEACQYDLCLVAYPDMGHDDVFGVVAAYPECVVLEAPTVSETDDGRMRLAGKIACHCPSELRVARGKTVVAKKAIGPGAFDLGRLAPIPKQAGTLMVSLSNVVGKRELGRF